MATSLVPRSRLVLQTDLSSQLGSVFTAGYLRNSRGVALERPRTYGRYALVYLLEGSGRMQTGNGPIVKCRAGDLLLVFPEIPQGYGPGPGERWSEFYLSFSGPVFDLWRRMGLLSPAQTVRHLDPIRRWLPRLEAIAAPSLPATNKGMLQRVSRLQAFLSDILEEKAIEAPWLDRAMQALTDRPDRTPEEVAASLGLSYETFRKEFARQAGMPPTRYRLARRIEQARRLIAEQGLSNKQVAESLGFYDEFHFSKRFRQMTGQGPREFRRHPG